jgi:hypothetical protein
LTAFPICQPSRFIGWVEAFSSGMIQKYAPFAAVDAKAGAMG